MRIDDAIITRAVAHLTQDDVIGLPTETVYGLAGNARSAMALQKIFALKQRPLSHPLIVHLPDVACLPEWAEAIPAVAYQLAAEFWPGPLTMVLRKKPQVLDIVTGGQSTIAVRVPGHPLALAILNAFGGGLAAPSANRFGRISPTRASDVYQELGDALPLIVDGGECVVGLESTIIDLTQAQPTVLRPGMISRTQITAVLQTQLHEPTAESPRVPGALLSHYAPSTPAYLVASDVLEGLLVGNVEKPIAVIAYSDFKESANINILSIPNYPAGYAHDLYHLLRLGDDGYDRILVEAPPRTLAWEAVWNRLDRACIQTRSEASDVARSFGFAQDDKEHG